MAADFQGADSVVKAFEARGIPTWAVFNKTKLMHSGEGGELLTEYLNLLQENFSGITYTLKCYRGMGADDVTDLSGSNGAFTFTLPGDGVGFANNRYAGGYDNTIGSRLTAIEKKLNGEGVEKKKDWGEVIMGWFEDPDDVVKLLGAVKMFTGKASPAEMMQVVSSLGSVEPKRAGAVSPAAGLPAVEQDEQFELTEQQEQVLLRYVGSIERLEKCDPEFPAHLEQLARIAETKPDLYKMALSFLK